MLEGFAEAPDHENLKPLDQDQPLEFDAGGR